jgi:transposase
MPPKGKGKNEQPPNNEPKRTYPIRSESRIEKNILKQREAAELLGISERHIKRLLKAYRQSGAEGLISKARETEQ